MRTGFGGGGVSFTDCRQSDSTVSSHQVKIVLGTQPGGSSHHHPRRRSLTVVRVGQYYVVGECANVNFLADYHHEPVGWGARPDRSESSIVASRMSSGILS